MRLSDRLAKLEDRLKPPEEAATVLITIGGKPFGMTDAEAEELLSRQPDGLIHIDVAYEDDLSKRYDDALHEAGDIDTSDLAGKSVRELSAMYREELNG